MWRTNECAANSAMPAVGEGRAQREVRRPPAQAQSQTQPQGLARVPPRAAASPGHGVQARAGGRVGPRPRPDAAPGALSLGLFHPRPAAAPGAPKFALGAIFGGSAPSAPTPAGHPAIGISASSMFLAGHGWTIRSGGFFLKPPSKISDDKSAHEEVTYQKQRDRHRPKFGPNSPNPHRHGPSLRPDSANFGPRPANYNQK